MRLLRSRSTRRWETKIPPERPRTRCTMPASSRESSDRPQRGAADAEPARELPLGSEPLAGRRRAGGDLGQEAVAQRGGRGAEGRHAGRDGHAYTDWIAARDSGSDLAAVHDDGLAGDVRGLVGREEQRRGADLLHLAEAAERDRRRSSRRGSPRRARRAPPSTTFPGMTALTVIPFGASSMQAVRTKPSCAALVAP